MGHVRNLANFKQSSREKYSAPSVSAPLHFFLRAPHVHISVDVTITAFFAAVHNVTLPLFSAIQLSQILMVFGRK
jgi:hypothetical protein